MNVSLATTRKTVLTLAAASLLIACDTEKADAKRKAAQPATASNNVVVSTASPTNVPPSQPARPGTLVVSPALNEIIKLAQAGVGEQVLLTYIENSPLSYKPNADEIVYLSDLGVSDPVIAALLKGGAPLQERVAGLQQAQPSGAPQAGVAPGQNPVAGTTTAATAASQAQPGLVGLSVTNAPQGGTLAAPAQPEGQPQYIVAQPVPSQPNYVETPAQAPAVTYVTQPPAVSYNYFYETLSPYGSWVDYPGYGYCWQPSVAVIDSGWRPYHHRGRWLYTDCGWYWQSDYSWGWAPFHYGRWVNTHNCGWLWSPDTVWAPAWVSWRHSRDHCGWAPLPPGATFVAGVGFHFQGARVGVGFSFGLRDEHYTFIRAGRLADRTPWAHYEPAAKNTSIAKNSTVVNNYIVGNNNTIINAGIDRDRLVAQTKQEIKKIPLQEVNYPQGPAHAADRVSKDGSSLAVYRPQVPQQAAKPPASIPTKTVDEAVRVASFSSRSEIPKTTPATGATLQPTKIAPSNLGGTTQTPQITAIPPRSAVVPANHGSASAPAMKLTPGKPAEVPSRNNDSTIGRDIPRTTQSPAAAGPVPSQNQAQIPSRNPVTSLPNRTTLPSARPVPATQEPRQGLVRPLENTAAPAQATPRQVQAEPSTVPRTLAPAANGPSAFRTGIPAPTRADPPPSGFRQDFRKIEAPPVASAPPPKFQNFQNTPPQRTFGGGPGANSAPRQNVQQPSGFRSSPAPSYNPAPPASFQNRPSPPPNAVAPSYRAPAPAQSAPPASRPQPSPQSNSGGNSSGGRRNEGNKN